MLTNLLTVLRGRLGRERVLATEPIVDAEIAPHIAKPAGAKPGTAKKQTSPKGELNPYVEARREWNERYGDYIQQAQHWRTLAIISSLVALISVVGVVYIGAQNKVVPYVVQVDKLGAVAAIARADTPASVDPRVVQAYLARFVADWRTVTIDRYAQKSAVDRVYSMLPSGSVALSKLNEYFKANNPFTLAAKRSVNVAVTNLLPLSDRTWQVEWQEVTRDGRGEIQSNVRMKVSIIVGITPPTDESQIVINPLGVYVTDLNWSRQL